MTKRMRLIGYQVQPAPLVIPKAQWEAFKTGGAEAFENAGWQVIPVVMADELDNDDLAPVQVQPLQVPPGKWAEFKTGGDEAALARLRAQIEGPRVSGDCSDEVLG